MRIARFDRFRESTLSQKLLLVDLENVQQIDLNRLSESNNTISYEF